MTISPVGTALPPLAPLPGSAAGPISAENKTGESFAKLVSGMVDKANQPQVQADAALRQLVMGETDSVHNVVMSAVQADMSFRFVLELRNRLTEAYQEIMRMQV